jgi:hypothetical protein
MWLIDIKPIKPTDVSMQVTYSGIRRDLIPSPGAFYKNGG